MRIKVNKNFIISVIVLSLLPLLSCILRMALDGRGLWEYYLAATIGNDEVFYYKYVEGVLEYGHPMGFFGFNESRALIGGGTAWSPIISGYWIILGKLLGWTYISPMLYNLLVMSLAMMLFAILVKPTKFQTIALSLLYLSYGQLAYYTLSGVPECIIYACVIVFMACVFRCIKEYCGKSVVLMWAAAFLLTCMRPYYIVLFLLPLYFAWSKNRKGAIVGFGIGAVLTAGIYFFFSKYMTASYFGESVLTRGISAETFSGSPWRVFKNLVKIGLYGIESSIQWMVQTFSDGNFQGRMLVALFVMFALILILFWVYRKEKCTNIILLYFVLYFPIRFAAAIYLYDKNMPPEAIRHSFDFILIAGMLVIMLFKKDKLFVGMSASAIVALIVTQFVIPMVYYHADGNYLDYASKGEVEQIRNVEAEFEKLLSVKEGPISYDNAIIWVFVDQVDGERTLMEWKAFYGIPAGMSLNICFGDYVIENYDSLQCAYLATTPGSDVSKLCTEKDANLIYHDTQMELYKINE